MLPSTTAPLTQTANKRSSFSANHINKLMCLHRARVRGTEMQEGRTVGLLCPSTCKVLYLLMARLKKWPPNNSEHNNQSDLWYKPSKPSVMALYGNSDPVVLDTEGSLRSSGTPLNGSHSARNESWISETQSRVGGAVRSEGDPLPRLLIHKPVTVVVAGDGRWRLRGEDMGPGEPGGGQWGRRRVHVRGYSQTQTRTIAAIVASNHQELFRFIQLQQLQLFNYIIWWLCCVLHCKKWASSVGFCSQLGSERNQLVSGRF